MGNIRRNTALFILSIICILCFAPHAASVQHAVVLQYHHFGTDTPPSTSVTVEQFKSHLKYLDKNGFVVWPLGKIVSYIQAQCGRAVIFLDCRDFRWPGDLLIWINSV